jgi:hypothetical protein
VESKEKYNKGIAFAFSKVNEYFPEYKKNKYFEIGFRPKIPIFSAPEIWKNGEFDVTLCSHSKVVSVTTGVSVANY